MPETLRELSARYATKQPHQVDSLLEGAPLLSKVPFVKSTHGLQHVMERISRIDEAAFVQRDEPLPEADVTTELGYMELGIMGFKVKAGQDKVTSLYGKDNFPKYLARKTPKIISKTGMKTDGFIAKLIKQYAVKNGNVIDCGATGSNTSSIIFVRFVTDETCGVYDENGFEHGALFDVTMLSNGKPYEDPTSKAIVYGAAFKNYTGFMFENPKTCAAIVNIDSTHKPTKEQIKKAMLMARIGDVGSSYIVAHPTVASDYIDPLRANSQDDKGSISTIVDEFDKIEIIRDWNAPDVEPKTEVTNKNMDTFGKPGEYGKELVAGHDISSEEKKESEARDFGAGGMNASIAIKAKATSKIASGAGTILLQHSDKKDGSFTDLYSFTIPETATAGDLLMEYILPSTFKGWLKVAITGNTGSSGKITVEPAYIPR